MATSAPARTDVRAAEDISAKQQPRPHRCPYGPRQCVNVPSLAHETGGSGDCINNIALSFFLLLNVLFPNKTATQISPCLLCFAYEDGFFLLFQDFRLKILPLA